MGRWVLVCVSLAGCLSSTSVECDGFVCPEGTFCDQANQGCVLGEQLVTCVAVADGVDCLIGGEPVGYCKNEVCVKSRCGDGVVRGAERCDSGDLDAQTCATLGYYIDGPLTCTADCVFETAACGGGKCGDHVLQQDHEFCEDGVAPREVSCLDFGFDLGRIGCSPGCNADFAACEHFGFFPVVTGATGVLRGIWGTGPDNLYVASEGSLYHFDGADWAPIPVGTTVELLAVGGTGANDIWAVGVEGTIVHFDGTAWSVTTLPSSTYPVYLISVWAVAPDDVYAVGASDDPSAPGVIAHWDGSAWTTMSTQVTTYDVWASASDDVYVVGEVGNVFHWNGTDWTNTVEVGGHLLEVWGTGPDDVWAGGVSAGVLLHRTTTGWSSMPLPFGATTVQSIHGAGGRLFIGTNVGVLVREGSVFSLIPSAELSHLWAISANDVWGITPFGSVRRFTGRAWLEDGNTLATPRVIAATSASYAVVATTGSSLNTIVQVWDGVAWTTLPQSPTSGIQAAWVAGVDDIFVVGGGSTNIARFVADSPTTAPYWHAMSSGVTATLLGVWGRSSSDVFAVGVAGIFHYNGTSWTQMTSNTTTTLNTVWGSATHVYAAGYNTMMRYDGTAWTAMTLPAGNRDLRGLWGTDTDNVYVGGSPRAILHWDGTSWEIQDSGVDETVRSISGTGPNDIFAVGSLGAVTHYDGTLWSPVRAPTVQSMTAVAATATRVFIVAQDGLNVLLRP